MKGKSVIFTRCLFAISLMGLIIVTLSNINCSLISDEVFSLELTEHSWPEMIQLAQKDVHPPLYYMILKLAVDVFGGENPYRIILIGKGMAMMPFYILFCLSWTIFRRFYGNIEAALFNCLLIGLPSIIHTGSLIRMYSWGMLFVTIAGVCIALILQKKQKINSTILWCGFVAGSVAACYTHYFCGVAVFCIYVSAGIWCIILERNGLRKLLISALAVLIAFVPWVAVLASQVKTVSADYWIPKITFGTVLGYCKFYLAPYTNAKLIYVVMAILLAIVVIGGIFRLLRQGEEKVIAVGMMLIVLEVITIGILVSILMRPVFVARYAIPASGLFCLGFGIALGSLLRERDNWKKIGMVAAMACAVTASIDILSFTKNELKYGRAFNEIKESMLDLIEMEGDGERENTAIVTDSVHLQGILAWFVPETMVYGEGFQVTEYSHELAISDNIAEAGAEANGATNIWLVHDTSKDSEWTEKYNLIEMEPLNTTIEQVNVEIYCIHMQ